MLVRSCTMDLHCGLLIWMAVHCILKLPSTGALKINGVNSMSSTYHCGTEVKLVCGADNPSDSMPPAISWAKDGTPVTQCFDTADNDCIDAVVDSYQYFTSDTTANTYTLTFNTIRMESAGVWSCQDGSNPAQQTVSVIEMPSIAGTVSVTNNGTSVTLECKTNCVTTASSSFEVSWEYKDGSATKTLNPIDGSTSTETSLPCTASGHCVLSTSKQHRRTAKFTTSSSCSSILQVRAKITITDKQLTNGVDSDYIAHTDYISTCIQGPDTTTTTTTSTSTTTTPSTVITTTTTTASTTTPISTTSVSTTLTSTAISRSDEPTSHTSTQPSSSTSNSSQKSEIIIVVSAVVGAVVLAGFLAILGFFLYRSRKAKNKHGRKKNAGQQKPVNQYLYRGPLSHSNFAMYPNYDINRNTGLRNPRSTDIEYIHRSHSMHDTYRQDGMPNHRSAYNNLNHTVYPTTTEYQMNERRHRPATSGSVYLGQPRSARRVSIYDPSKDYADNWNLY